MFNVKIDGKNLTDYLTGKLAKPSTMLGLWSKCRGVPGGRRIFSKWIGVYVPYSGSIEPMVDELGPGGAKIKMKDQRKIRNHLNSVHALALANLGELTGGLSVMASVPDDCRFILKGIEVEYLKKARGSLHSQAECQIIKSNEERDFNVKAEIRNEAEEIVCTVVSKWQIGPV